MTIAQHANYVCWNPRLKNVRRDGDDEDVRFYHRCIDSKPCDESVVVEWWSVSVVVEWWSVSVVVEWWSVSVVVECRFHIQFVSLT